MSRQYPRQAWVLTPSFKPKEVTIIKPYGGICDEWDVAEGGKLYHKDLLFHSVSDAITNGRAQVESQKADIVKRQERLSKRITALDKAESASQPTKGGSHAEG